MVASNRVTAMAVGLAVILLGPTAAGAEAPQARKVPAAADLIDAQLLRATMDADIREQSRQLREALNEDLRRELTEKIVLSTNELVTKS